MLYKEFLKTITSCPFCENKNRIIIENDYAFLTYSLAPYHKHHLLVLPKRHVESFLELNAEEDAATEELIRVAMKILQQLNYNDYSVLVRNGDKTGRSVKHLHYHVIPEIQIGDLDHYGKNRLVLTNEEEKNLLTELKTVCETAKLN